MENKPSLTYYAMNYGLYFGLALILVSFVSFIGDFASKSMQFAIVSGLISIVLYIGALVWFTRQTRKKYFDDCFTYSQAFSFGVSLVFFSTLVLSVYLYVQNQFIDPDYLRRTFESQKEMLYNFYVENKVPQKQIDKIMKILEEKGVGTAIGNSLQVIWNNFLVGGILSFIIAFFVKKEANPFAFTDEDSKETNDNTKNLSE